jgi:transporter family protein
MGIFTAAICGVLGGFSTIIFYMILKQIPANIAIPVSSLYIIITIVLSYFFLGETMSIRQFIGIIMGCIAVILITS